MIANKISQGKETNEPKITCDPEKTTRSKKNLKAATLNRLNLFIKAMRTIKNIRKKITSLKDNNVGVELFSIKGAW